VARFEFAGLYYTVRLWAQMRAERPVLAFITAPIVTPLFFTIPELFKGTIAVWDVPTLIVAILIYSYAFTIVFAVPSFFLFRRYNIKSHWAFAAMGAMIGQLVFIVLGLDTQRAFDLIPTSQEWWREGGWSCVAAASLSAVVFRAISN
jgi:hypothetical protein